MDDTYSYPWAKLDTKLLGALTLTVLDPDARDDEPLKYGNTTHEKDALCIVEGEAKVNGIPCRFRVHLSEHRPWNKEKNEPGDEVTLWVHHAYSSDVRRLDGSDKTYGVAATDNQRQKVYGIVSATAKAYLDAHPELRREARRITLRNRIVTAARKVNDAHEALHEAQANAKAAEMRLIEFDNAAPHEWETRDGDDPERHGCTVD